MANNPYINKVEYGGNTLIDLTSDTVDSSNLLSGYTAHDRSGASIVGSAVIPTVNDGTLTIQRNGVNVQTFSANQSTNVTANILVDELTEVTDNEPYTLRQGKGDMVDLSLVGGSIAWNQLVQNGNFASTSGWTALAGGSFTVGGNVATISITANYGGIQCNVPEYFARHKYLITATIKASSQRNNSVGFGLSTSGSQYAIRKQFSVGTFFTTCSFIGTLASGTPNNYRFMIFDTSGSDNVTLDVKNIMVIDLTQLFGTTIADAIYAMEQATSGSGVAFFRKYFPKDYYAYDSGSIQSVNVASRKVYPTGKNRFDGVWGYGVINTTTGEISANNYVKYHEYIMVKPSTWYTMSAYNLHDVSNYFQVFGYDENKNYTGIISVNIISNTTALFSEKFQTPNNVAYIRMHISSTTLGSSDKQQLEYGQIVTAWEEFKQITYPFDTTKQLRGIPSIVNNKLVYDGDVLKSDGSVTRKYKAPIDLGSLEWVKAGNYNNIFYTQPSDIKSGVSGKIQTICASYLPVACNDFSTLDNYYDKVITVQKNASTLVVVDSAYSSSTASQFKTAMSGKYVSYVLATPTTESAEPYQNPQRSDASGTEEFVDYGVESSTRDVSIPCGHNSTYKSSEVIQPLEDYVDGYRINEIRDDVEYYEQNGFLSKNLFIAKNFTEQKKDGIVFPQLGEGAYISQDLKLPAGTYTVWILLKSKPSANRTIALRNTTDGADLANFTNISSFNLNQVYSTTFTISGEKTCSCRLWGVGGGSFEMQIQIEKGSTATSYTPYAPSNNELDANLPQNLATSTTALADSDVFATGQASDSKWYRKTLSLLWNYIKGKIGIDTSGTTFLRKDGTWVAVDGGTEKLYATGSYTSSTSAVTTVTATNANISIDSTTPVEVFTDVFGVNLTNMTVSGSGTSATISITFPKTTSAQTINYRVYVKTI